jgi:hypothetical protein
MTKIIWILLLLVGSSLAGLGISPEFGVIAEKVESKEDEEVNNEFRTDFLLRFYWSLDQMILLGPSAGYRSFEVEDSEGESKKVKEIPLTAVVYIRLPIGRVLMPALVGEWGYVALREKENWIWRYGLVGDMKLGDRSSLLLSSGFEQSVGEQRPYAFWLRGGLLFEW